MAVDGRRAGSVTIRAMTPSIGIQLPEVERVVRWPEYLAIARAAEEVGFDSVWVGDHLLYRGGQDHYGDAQQHAADQGPWEAWTVLAALAAATERVRLGPLVACAGFHNAGMLAKKAAALAEISGGRFVLGLGSGWNEAEFQAFGFPTDRKVSRFAESFEIVRRLLDGERVTFDGDFHRAQDLVLLPEGEHRVELMVGSNGPRMLSIALPWAHAWNTWYDDYGNTAEGFAALNGRIDDACRQAGRDPGDVRRSACAYVVLDRDAGERPIIVEAPPIEGTPDGIAARLRELGEAGADEIIVVANPITERAVRALGDVLALL
jgi:alkanesulfonate monooxygenase SsuD/methylene tetrahydromethanopterin reductase-like flavin-dependent oxidoreductase (luciferase family)